MKKYKFLILSFMVMLSSYAQADNSLGQYLNSVDRLTIETDLLEAQKRKVDAETALEAAKAQQKIIKKNLTLKLSQPKQSPLVTPPLPPSQSFINKFKRSEPADNIKMTVVAVKADLPGQFLAKIKVGRDHAQWFRVGDSINRSTVLTGINKHSVYLKNKKTNIVKTINY